MTHPPSGSVEPVTVQVGRRVSTLRKAAGLTQEDLGQQVADLGLPGWGRTTVAKLESGGRKSVSVQELLALGLVFGVPPLLLIADPREAGLVPIAPDFEADQWSALAWLVGAAAADPEKRQLEYRGLNKQGGDPAWIVSNALWVGLAISDIAQMQNAVTLPVLGGDPPSVSTEEQERKAFEALRQVLRRIVVGSGLAAPDVGEAVRRRALELGVDLDIKSLSMGEG